MTSDQLQLASPNQANSDPEQKDTHRTVSNSV